MQRNKGFFKEVANGKAPASLSHSFSGAKPSKARKRHAAGIAVQRRRKTISDRYHFIRRTVAVLLTCGIILGLLPGFAAAQDYTAARAEFILNRDFGTHRVGGKGGAWTLLARLEQDPSNPQFLDNIAYYWGTAGDPMPTGDDKTFSSPGLGWLVNKHGHKLTQAQRNNLLFQAKRYNFPANPNGSGGGTENHRLMQDVGAILLTQFFPGETGWQTSSGLKTSEELYNIARNRVLIRLSRIYDRGAYERLSVVYTGTHFQPLLALYENVNDPALKAAANAALVYYTSELAMASLEGVVAHPCKRSPWQSNTEIKFGTATINWFYWGELMNIPEGTSGGGVAHALSSWRPPAALRSLFAGDGVVPFISTSSSMGGSETWFPADMVTYFYRTAQYAMGSAYFNMAAGKAYAQDKGFMLAYKSSKKFNIIECGHNYWTGNADTWAGIFRYHTGSGTWARNNTHQPTVSPFTQRAQHESTAILLFDVPTADPWAGYGLSHVAAQRDQRHDNLWQEVWFVYPQSIDEVVEDSGWIFLREGTVYVAIRPVGAYTSAPEFEPLPGGVHVMVRSQNADGKNAAIFDIATQDELVALGQSGTFAAFRAAVLANPPTIDLTVPSVTYTNVKGVTISLSWTPVNYDVPEGTPVLIRPTWSVNGVTVPIDTDFENEVAVIKSPPLRLEGRVLTIDTPSGGYVVDWRGEYPIISKELVTMVQKKKGDTHFLVYPNPAHDYLVIDKEMPLANPVKIDLVNVSGISMYSAQEVTFPYILRLQGINPGIYFLKIHSPEGFVNQIIAVK